MASTYPTSLDSFTNPSASSLLTSPSHAQQHSDINDAMEAVQTKLAIGNTVIGTYEAYVPTLYTQFTLGNGTVSTRWCRVNNLIHYYGTITFGSTSVVTGANFGVRLPVIQSTLFTGDQFPLGATMYYDASTTARYIGQATQSTSGYFRLWVLNTQPSYTSQTFCSATVPMTWAVGDVIRWNITYEAA
jgi:hypothetical protein